jgi:hypothetical protein
MNARQAYEQALAAARADAARLDPVSAVLGHGRVLVVFAAIALFAWAGRARAGEFGRAFGGMGALVVGSWLAQSAVDRRVAAARRRAAYHQRGLDRLDGKWRSFPSTGADLAGPDHPYARDLDVVGAGSLFQLLDTTHTKQGESTLAGWLLAPAPLEVVTERAASVRNLVPELAARERLALAAFEEEAARVDERALLEFATSESGFTRPAVLRAAAWLLPATALGAAGAAHLGMLSSWVPVAIVVVELAILRALRDRLHAITSVAERSERELERLLPLFVAAATQPRATPQLMRLAATLGGADAAVRGLRARVTFLQSRVNLIVALVAPVLMWDLHGALLLDAWRRRHGRELGPWLAALGELEGLHSLATYAFEHPDDAWPEVTAGEIRLEAAGLAHALLEPDASVRNDVTLEGPGRALLVTGSNMSGKSTLLRSVGLAAVMAQAGLPVRAARLQLSTMQVATCMRVSDSLQEGASFFLAEVLRLRAVVDLTHGARPVLFLLDEILQGTNTRERSLGARGVVSLLVGRGASGLVSTHDLSLVRLGDVLGDRLAYAHFTDRVEDGRMVFDYRMRPGVVQGSNALRVMRAHGLDVELPADADGV